MTNHQEERGETYQNEEALVGLSEKATNLSQEVEWEERVIKFLKEIGVEDHLPAIVRLIRPLLHPLTRRIGEGD